MPETEIAKAIQLLDLMLEFFADDGSWTRGCYDDGKGGPASRLCTSMTVAAAASLSCAR